jgi:hypothetical protein
VWQARKPHQHTPKNMNQPTRKKKAKQKQAQHLRVNLSY